MLLCMELVAENEERLVRVRERVYLPVAQQKQESLHKVEKKFEDVPKSIFYQWRAGIFGNLPGAEN